MKTIIIIVLCLMYTSHSYSQTKWDFPVTPGTQEWKALTTHEEMVSACQIPAQKLSELTTEELADLCIDYPIYIDFFAYNNMQKGLERVYEQFNGLRELINRKNSLPILSQKLIDTSNEIIDLKNTSKELGNLITRQTLLSLFCSQKCLLENAEEKELLRISRAAFNNLLQNYHHKEIYSHFCFETNSTLLYNSLYQLDIEISRSAILNDLMTNGGFTDKDTIVDELGTYYLNITSKYN